MAAQTSRPRSPGGVTAAGRASIYAFLAETLTSPPTRESVRRIRGMARVLDLPCPDDWPLDKLEEEYRILFVVPNPRYVAPYESVYRDAWQLAPCGVRSPGGGQRMMIKGLLMGESTLSVRQCYADAGVAPAEDLPDHLGNELRFMAYLWHREAAAPPRTREETASVRARFRDQHLLKWIRPLLERVQEGGRLGFHAITLQIAELVLKNDGRALPRATVARTRRRARSSPQPAFLPGVP